MLPGCVGKPGGQEMRISDHVSPSPQFQEVLDLVARFEGLLDTQAILKLAEINRRVEMEETRVQLLSLREAKQDELLRLSQQRIQLCVQLETARELTLQRVRISGVPIPCASPGAEALLRHRAPKTVLVTTPQNTWVPPLGR